MSILILVIILVFLALGSWLALLLMKGETILFTKRVMWYLFFHFLGFAVLGSLGFLLRPPAISQVFWVFFILLLVSFLLGVLYVFQREKLHSWIEVLPRSLGMEFLFALFLLSLNGIAFATIFWMTEFPGWDWEARFVDDMIPAFLVYPIPFVLKTSRDLWNRIPVEKINTWILPIDAPVPLIEPGRSVILHFHIPVTFRSKETIKFNTRAPIEKDLGEIFYFLLYRHNIERRAFNKIQIAEDNKKAKMYGWQFYKKEKLWGWWDRNKYVDPEQNLKRQGLKTGDVIHVRRVITW